MSRNTNPNLLFKRPSKNYKGRSIKKGKFPTRISVETFEVLRDLAIEANLSDTDTGKLYKAVASIIRQDGNGLFFAPISRNYWRKRLGDRYKRILDLLEKDGLIEIDHFYLNRGNKKGSVCKKFKLTNKLLKSPLLKVAVNCTFDLPATQLDKKTYRIVKELQLDKPAASLWVEDYLKDSFMKRIKLNDEIRRKSVLVHEYDSDKAAYYSFWAKTDKLLIEAKREGQCVIEDKRKVIKRDLEEFKLDKIRVLKHSYLNSINHFGLGGCSRNPLKIGRLYTPITNLPNGLFDYITLDGEHLSSIDLRNSQMLLLTHLIEKLREAQTHPSSLNQIKQRNSIQLKQIIKNYQSTNPHDVACFVASCVESVSYRDFKRAAQEGKLYELIEEELGLRSRLDAKIVMFEILFSGNNNSSEDVKAFKTRFPELSAFVSHFKKMMGSEELSISLQKIEAGIFIDVILKKLLKKGFKCLSKHDSILCKKSDEVAVRAVIETELDKIIGLYELGIDVYGDNEVSKKIAS